MQQLQGVITVNDGFTPALKSMANGMSQLLGMMEDMAQTTGHAFDDKKIFGMRASIDRLNSSLKQIDNVTDENTKSQREHNKAMRDGKNDAGNLLETMKRMAGVAALVASAKAGLDLSNQLINDEARLKMMLKGSEDVAAVRSKIWDSAYRSSSKYQDAISNVTKLGMQAGNAFKNTNQVIAFNENLNKAFSIAGSSNEQKASAVYNMTQALASGVLRGQDFNAIMQSAPNIFDYVANYMAKKGKKSADYYRQNMRKMAFEGELTGDIIVNSMISATDDINKKFDSMPFNFENQMTRLQNFALRAFQPISNMIRDMVNSQAFISTIGVIGGALVGLGELFASVANFVVQHWSVVRWLFVGISIVIGGLMVKSIQSMTLSFGAFLSKLSMAHPMILGVAAGVSLVGALLSALGISISTFFQYLFAVCYEIGALIINGIIFIGNLMITMVEMAINAWNLLKFSVAMVWYGMQMGAAMAFNFISKGFTGFINGLIEKFEGFLNFFIDGWNGIIDLLNKFSIKVPGWVPFIGGQEWGFNLDHASRANLGRVEAKTIDTGSIQKPQLEKTKLDRLQYMDMGWDTAKNFGKGAVDFGAGLIDGIGKKINSFDMSAQQGDMTSQLGDMSSLMSDMGKGIAEGTKAGKGTKKNTDKMAKDKELKRVNDNLDYLKSISERRSIINVTWDKLNVSVNNSFGDVHETADLDGWLPTINTALGEVINASVGSVVTEGV